MRNMFYRIAILASVIGLFLPSVVTGWYDGLIIVGSCIFTAVACYPSK